MLIAKLRWRPLADVRRPNGTLGSLYAGSGFVRENNRNINNSVIAAIECPIRREIERGAGLSGG